MSLTFQILCRDVESAARRCEITTAHGVLQTPMFMSVGTFGSVRFLRHEDLELCGTQIILGNSYHLYLRPGPELLKTAGGYHKLISWDKPILTDSGGFQIFSLPHQRTITEKSVTFKSYIDSSYQILTPEKIIEFQEIIGSDIMMCLDVCLPSTSIREECVLAMERTHRWAKRCKVAKKRTDTSLFGIVQGGIFEDLRRESVAAITDLDFDGYAVGGLAVGESDEERYHFTEYTASLLPANKPRYLMGVGTPHDLVRSILAGIDMFDCIIPTNHAKQGVAYSWQGKVKLRRRDSAADPMPIDPQCECPTCKRYSRAYLYQLIKSDEPTGWSLIALHNTWFYEKLMLRCREEIVEGRFASFARWFLSTVSD